MTNSLVATRRHNASVPQLEDQPDAKEDKVIVDYEPDEDFEPEGPGPNK